MKTLKYDKKDLKLIVRRYSNNNRLFVGILIDDEIESYYDDLTFNFPQFPFYKNSQAFLNPNIPSKLKNKMREDGLFGNTIFEWGCNGKIYEMVNFNLEKLKEYDSKGVKKFLKTNSYER